ncbi:GntR family transcriptional regulator [Variovorax ginsengisoli]|uniref:DNA-binding GntR family transcriptional regulator n=1 Tax=Variovorax ginsengisoli TaxID=363844 RepID=A0ABT9SBF1_9BURK|nr:GntR family transcriptional regulator [Variovorax ginsengisoli]MDP9900707.1 DNA-binding GntR family transcriptional regulator [Variovorax ginsengisoli]
MKQQNKPQEATSETQGPSRLQRDLLPRALDYLRSAGLKPGDRTTELALAQHLQVSRTPVRAVLEELARQGVLDRQPRRGFTVRAVPETTSSEATQPGEVDQLCFRLAGDRHRERLPAEVSEADLMRRYGVSRPLLLRVLGQLSEIGMAERKPGHGWAFPPILDERARRESYEFRLLVEPAGVIAEGFQLDMAWVTEMRRRHQAFLEAPWSETSSIELFEMNAAFHEGLALASGNRFILNAIRQQSRMRRFSNYDWTYGQERVRVSCIEHLEILDRLERGQREVAAALIRRHLEEASLLTRPTEAS